MVLYREYTGGCDIDFSAGGDSKDAAKTFSNIAAALCRLSCTADAGAAARRLGLGRIVALCYRSSTLYLIH